MALQVSVNVAKSLKSIHHTLVFTLMSLSEGHSTTIVFPTLRRKYW